MRYRWTTGTYLLSCVVLSCLMLLGQDAAPPPATPQFPATNDPQEIVRRSVEIDHRMMERARNYTCQQREVEKHLDSHGNVKSTEIKTWDITILYGEPYSRLIQKNDQPLNEKDEKKEQEKLDKFVARHKAESEDERRKREEKQ